MKTKYDWKKSEKKYYLPKVSPELVKVPAFRFFTIAGQGNPNDNFFGEYISALYSLSYSVKMAPRNGTAPEGYFEYSVYPLEGIWDISDEAKRANQEKLDKNTLVFTLMIRQPDFVTEDYAQWLIGRVGSKKPNPLLGKVRFEEIEDGKCVQMLHVGPYDDEPESFGIMEEFCRRNELARASKIHREIYLSDVRKTSPEKLRTVLRFRVL